MSSFYEKPKKVVIVIFLNKSEQIRYQNVSLPSEVNEKIYEMY